MIFVSRIFTRFIISHLLLTSNPTSLDLCPIRLGESSMAFGSGLISFGAVINYFVVFSYQDFRFWSSDITVNPAQGEKMLVPFLLKPFDRRNQAKCIMITSDIIEPSLPEFTLFSANCSGGGERVRKTLEISSRRDSPFLFQFFFFIPNVKRTTLK